MISRKKNFFLIIFLNLNLEKLNKLSKTQDWSQDNSPKFNLKQNFFETIKFRAFLEIRIEIKLITGKQNYRHR